MLHCTDKSVDVEAHVLNHNKGIFLEAAINTVKLRMNYVKQHKSYVGSMAGLEFTIHESNIPDQNRKDYSR
jgi:hypothetical protein